MNSLVNIINMGQLYVFGDAHFSALNPWNKDVDEKFIEWFRKFCETQPGCNSIIWLGDITERDVNPGNVVDQVTRLFQMCSDSFKEVFVVMGNHDLKLYRGDLQHSLKFLENFKNVKVVTKVEDIMIQHILVRFMPFQRIEGTTLNDYYSNLTWDSKPEADLTVGHWNKTGDGCFDGVDISKMKTKEFCLGHIHTRISPEYIGSLFPNKSTEVGERVYKVYNKDCDEDKMTSVEVKLPTFLSYDVIKYPDKIADVKDDAVHIYSVSNIHSLNEAKVYYKNYYIKSLVPDVKAVNEDKVTSSEVFVFQNSIQALNSWLKETKSHLSRQASLILNTVLK